MLVTLPTPVSAQDGQGVPSSPVAAPATDEVVSFSADQVVYESDSDIVTASGDVRMNRDGN